MTDKNSSQEQQSTSGEAWGDVGRQFKNLGESLAAAFNITWQSEETRQNVQKVQTAFTDAANQINEAVKNAAESEEGQKVQEEVSKAAKSAQATGQQVYDDVSPELVSAFRFIRGELDKIINRMENDTPASAPTEPEAESEEAPSTPSEETE